MDTLLARLHEAVALQTRLANTAAIMALYLHHLLHRLQSEPGNAVITDEVQLASRCLPSVTREQADAARASFWVVRRHLWLSQSPLQQSDRDCLLRLPVDPSAMFGPDTVRLLQQAKESRHCAQMVTGGFSEHGRAPKRKRVNSTTPPPARVPSWDVENLPPMLEAFCQRRKGEPRQPAKSAAGQEPPKGRPPTSFLPMDPNAAWLALGADP